MTIRELARLAGVSTATVSRVFSHHSVKEEIKNRVLSLARTHHYHPRFSSRRRNVVILTPYDAVFPVQSCVDMLLMAMAQVLPQRDFRLEILPVNNLARLDSIQFCGAIAVGIEESDVPGWNDRFAVPLVVVDRYPQKQTHGGNVYFIHSDEVQAMHLAIGHLVSGGCRKIGCIVHGSPGKGNAKIRFDAAADALQKHHLPCDRMLCYAGESPEKYVELVGKMLRHGADALFCPGGNAGLMTLYSMSLYGKKIPDDVALIASEQTAFSQYTVPPQTTISPDYRKIAECAADLLDGWLDGRKQRTETVLDYHLIVRESTPETTPAGYKRK